MLCVVIRVINIHDIISPIMADMLSYLGSQSTFYAKSRRSIIAFPDENFARESKYCSWYMIKMRAFGSFVLYKMTH